MPKKKIILILSAIVLLLICFTAPKIWAPETKTFKAYSSALEKYNNSEYQKAYYAFAKIPRFSKLKPAAIYKQALCADKLGDKKSRMKKYKELLRKYPNSKLALRVKYLRAQSYYEADEIKKAQKEFAQIIRKYPKTDYAIASEYYFGSIETAQIAKIKNKRKKEKAIAEAVHHFRIYLTEAPSGRFATNSIKKWGYLTKKITNEDNLLIARAYQANQDYESAAKYLKFTNINASWPYFVKNAYALKDYPKVKYYTVLGLKGKDSDKVRINEDINLEEENKNIYDAIDDYLSLSGDPKTSISYLLSIAKQTNGNEYLQYKSCTNMPSNAQLPCFNSVYLKYPEGQFAAEELANIFYSKIQSGDYFSAKKIGKKHLSKYPDAKSAPRVMFWLAKAAERTKNYEESRSYYKSLISKYGDDYYAYHAFLNLNKFSHPVIDTTALEGKEVLFPYKKTLDNDLLFALVDVKDYGLINELCKDDEFVQSWLAYKKGEYWTSAVMARDAMEKMEKKPGRKDPRWRLVYPVHYYKEIEENSNAWNNSPILILSIIREESYFNPKIKSPAGASGLMQLMPATAREVGSRYGIKLKSPDFLLEPDINIRLGNMYYAQLRTALLNRDVLAVLAYNGGIGSVKRWRENLDYQDVDDFVEQIPYPETQNYLKKVYKSYWNYVRIYSEE